MKKALTIGLVAAALAATLPFVFAGSKSQAVTPADTKPEYKIAARVRMADASVAVPAYTRGPRIIHVPQPGERNERASVNERDDPDLSNNDIDDDEVAPPPRRRMAPPVARTTPRWPPRREASPPPKPKPVRRAGLPKVRTEAPAPRPPIPQPPGPRRAVLSAPPPPAEGPTPIRPTPKFETKFGAKAEAAEKFATPPVAEITADTPPPGYSPPAAPPQDDGYGNKY